MRLSRKAYAMSAAKLAGALIMAGTYALANFAADIAYVLLDKRIRYD